MGILKDYEQGVAVLEDWLTTQFHLPQIDKILLLRFIHSCQGDLEKAKKLIELNYVYRNTYSNIFLDRDPCSEAGEKILKATDMLILPGATPEGYKVLFYRLADLDPNKFHFTEAIKMFFMMADLRFITTDAAGIGEGEVPIFDMAGYSLRHMTKVVPSSLRAYMKFTQEAHPIRLKTIHVINCPPYLDKLLSVIKPLIKSEVFKLITFHLPGSNTLDKFVPRDMLPNEYGGKAGNIEDIKFKWTELMKQKRDYLMNEKYWKVNDAKRPNKQQSYKPQLNDMNGNFRTLAID